jgi:hypothetical protein
MEIEIDELLGIATTSEFISADIAQEILSLGMSEFLSHGISYDKAIDLITKAQLSVARQTHQESVLIADTDDSE